MDDEDPVDSAEEGNFPANRHEAVVGTQTKDSDREFDIRNARAGSAFDGPPPALACSKAHAAFVTP